MFKAKLITNPRYYALRRQQLLLPFLIVMPVAFLVNPFKWPIWITIGAFCIYILVAWLTWRNEQKIKAATGEQRLEIEADTIRILDGKGQIIETILPHTIDKIEVKNSYAMPQESIKDMVQEMKGYPQRHYIRMVKAGQTRQLDFEVDTHYMLNQLRKILSAWEQAGYAIKREPI